MFALVGDAQAFADGMQFGSPLGPAHYSRRSVLAENSDALAMSKRRPTSLSMLRAAAMPRRTLKRLPWQSNQPSASAPSNSVKASVAGRLSGVPRSTTAIS